MNLTKLISMAALVCVSTTSFSSEWAVDNAHSELSFISTKKGNVAETHQFTNLNGTLDVQGNFTLSIDLASVDTNNIIRDERMKNFLFEVNKFATGTLKAYIAPSDLDAIAEGASQRLSVDTTLSLHGMDKKLPIDIVVTRLVGAKFSVASVKPVLLKAEDFSLVAGVEKLRELANLPSISHTVPVSFYLILNLKKQRN
jgi:polyisoprenoid-binding protein YceI